MARRRYRSRRRRSYRKRRRNPKLLGKHTLYGAGGGAIAGLLLTAGAGAARGLPASPAMPKNAAIGAVLGALAASLAKTNTGAAIMGVLASGTGIYLVNVAAAAAAPVTEPELAGFGEYVTPGSFLEGLGQFDPLMATRMQLGPLSEYVTPGAFLEGYVDSSNYNPLSEYVTPGSFLEGLGAMDRMGLQPPQGIMPTITSFRGRIGPQGKCAVC